MKSSGPITESVLNLGGTLASTSSSLREVLDASLSSPSGRGVITDESGVLLGTITAEAVLALIREQRAAG